MNLSKTAEQGSATHYIQEGELGSNSIMIIIIKTINNDIINKQNHKNWKIISCNVYSHFFGNFLNLCSQQHQFSTPHFPNPTFRTLCRQQSDGVPLYRSQLRCSYGWQACIMRRVSRSMCSSWRRPSRVRTRPALSCSNTHWT